MSELLVANGFHPELAITGSQFSQICPSLVQQVVSESCIEEEDSSSEEDELTESESKFEVVIIKW